MAKKKSDLETLKPETRLVMAAREFTKHGSVAPPVYHISTYLFPTLADFFEGLEPVTKRVVEEYLGANTARSFDDLDHNVNQELDRLKQKLNAIDPTLGDALETGRKKIQYQLEGLRTRFVRAQMTRDDAAHRQLQRAADQLYPNKDLQERHINITSLLSRHGTYVIEWIYNAINIGSNDHQVVYL